MATFSSGVKCFRSFLIRSLRYLNGRTLSPFPTEAGHLEAGEWRLNCCHGCELVASNRKPESNGIVGKGGRRNQNDRGDAFGRKFYRTRDVGIPVNIRRKCLGKEEFSLG